MSFDDHSPQKLHLTSKLNTSETLFSTGTGLDNKPQILQERESFLISLAWRYAHFTSQAEITRSRCSIRLTKRVEAG